MAGDVKPRPQDDEAIAAMCAWLKKNKLIGLGTRSGRLLLMPKEETTSELFHSVVPIKKVKGYGDGL
jgi:hypothetical protein